MARGERLHCKTCIRKAEMLHGILRDNQNEFASPHLLMSEEWIYPFCLSQPIFETRVLGASSPFVDAAIFLVDLHLPHETIQVRTHQLNCLSIDIIITILVNTANASYARVGEFICSTF